MRYAPVADLMLRDRYKTIRSYLHVADNTKNHLKTLKTQNKPYKVPSVIVHVKKNCIKIEPEQYQSIDEQIVPAKLVLVEYYNRTPKKQQNGASKILFVLAPVVLFMISFSTLGQLETKSAMVLIL